MLIEPVEIEAIGPMVLRWPRRMIDPLPNCFSIWPTAMSMALVRSFRSSRGMRAPLGGWPALALVAPGEAGRENAGGTPRNQWWRLRVTAEVTAGVDPRSVPRESQAKIGNSAFHKPSGTRCE